MSLKKQTQLRIKEVGLSPRKKWGQNFLINEHVVNEILKAVRERKPEALIEIGPGLGALTDGLLEMAQPLKLIDVDPLVVNYWQRRGADILFKDALKVDLQELFPGKQLLLVSNLPYQISSKIIIDVSVKYDGFDSMILMLQKEVAQRLVAPPHTSDYGMLSVVAQHVWNMKSLVDVSPGSFYPSPSVDSRVVLFLKKPDLLPLSQRRGFLNLVKSGFAQRRKVLLKKLQPLEQSGREADKLFRQEGWDLKLRAENLSPDDFLKLFLYLRAGSELLPKSGESSITGSNNED